MTTTASTDLDDTGRASTDLDETGPIDYLVVEFPGNRMTGEGFPLLIDLVDRGIIRILDLVFVTRDTDGSVAAMEIADFDGDGQLDLAVFQGASSGLIGPDDIDEAASVDRPGQLGRHPGLREHLGGTVRPALRRGGGQLVASGRIPVQAILAALDAVEADWPPGRIGREAASRLARHAGLAAANATPSTTKGQPCQVCFVESPAPPSSPEPPPPSPDASSAVNRAGGPPRRNKPPPSRPHRSRSMRIRRPERPTTSWRS